MKKAFVLFTLLAVVVFAFGFTSCKQEADPESGNPFIGTWISTDGVFKIVFTETDFTLYQIGESGIEGAGWCDYNGNRAYLTTIDERGGSAVISGDILTIYDLFDDDKEFIKQ